MDDSDRDELLGELKVHAEHTNKGIDRIEGAMTTFSQNVRDDIIKLHEKADKAHG